MLPKWFNTWNRDNPTNIYGPAILVGAAGVAVTVAAFIVVVGQPFKTDSLQTGPRGTGMSVPEFVSEVRDADPTIAGYLRRDDITEEDIAGVSAEALQNVPPALGNISDEDYARLVVAMRSWTGIPDLMEDPDNYQTQIAYTMVGMVQSINEDWIGHVQSNAVVGVNCYTCHRGQAVPSEIWFRLGPVNEAAGGWAAVQNRVTVQSQYTSLPSDALESYLLDYGRIGVHDLEAHVAAYPSEEGYPTWQDTERTFSLMNYVSNSLGVNCVFCHNSRAFYDPEQVTPQWATEMLGITMVQEINNDWLVPLEGLYPEERLGPVFADAPKAACKTCHKGYQQPLQGLNVIDEWPELALTDPES
ncbi:photosynthetic reaction center cytochrome PufC [uncultured Marivita sp.]|uniref:photosynthetic reaction center cytochrome PufC n=1 Tax=uncultured Marivita sp. TaxID=888080 RepID=UPI002603A636|nr:photosynthetic reaction center cytochrome PufC [uncultured Marivita sp.]